MSVTEAPTKTIAQQEAERGAEFLDEHLPGWERQIDLRRLDLGTCNQCVLGQLYGDFGIGLEELFTGVFDESWHGMGFARILGVEWETLTDAWIEQVEART